MVTRDSTTEVLPSGLMTENIPNLKRRQRSHYIRPVTHSDGDKTWMTWDRTGLLPSDVEGRAYYMAKGFRLDPPEGSELTLNNTAKEEVAKAKADAAAKDNLLQQQSDMLQKLSAEIAALKEKLEDKGKQETQGKVGRPRKVGG